MNRKWLLALGTSVITSSLLAGCSQTTSNEADPLVVLQNENARIALNLSIDNEMLVEQIIMNGSVATDSVVPKGLATGENGNDYRDYAGKYGYEHDDEKAKEYWEKAKEEVGFDSVRFDLITNDDDTGKITAEFIQGEIEQALDGATVEIRQLPSKQKIDAQIKHEYSLSNSLWSADFPDPLDFLGIFTTDGFFANRMQYSNKEYDEIVSKGKNAETTEQAWETFKEAEQTVLDDSAIIPLYQRGKSFLQKDYVEDVIMYGYGLNTSYRYAKMNNGEKDLRTTINSDIPTLDISKATDSTSFLALGNILEGLTTFDKEGKVVPAIAESWEQSEDGKTWTFKLRNDATWSNGDKITAKDFEYSFKRTLAPDTASQYGYLFNDIVGAEDYNLGKVDNADNVGVKAIDDYTFQVTLNRRVNYFDKLMVFPIFYPQNEVFVNANLETYGTNKDAILYNGPFTISEWKMEDTFTFTKNPNYREKDTVNIENVHFKISKQANTTANLYEDGQVDRIEISSEFAEKYKDSKELINFQEPAVSFIMMNVGGPKE